MVHLCLDTRTNTKFAMKVVKRVKLKKKIGLRVQGGRRADAGRGSPLQRSAVSWSGGPGSGRTGGESASARHDPRGVRRPVRLRPRLRRD